MLDQKLLSLNDTAAILGVPFNQVLTMVSNGQIDCVMSNGWKYFTIEAVVKAHHSRQEERNQSRFGGTAEKVFENAAKNWWD